MDPLEPLAWPFLSNGSKKCSPSENSTFSPQDPRREQPAKAACSRRSSSRAKRAMLVGTEKMALRGWLVAIALFEVPNIAALLKGAPLDGFFSTLKNAPAEKRAYSMILAFLMLSRFQAAAYPSAPGVMAHCAAVHALEALVFGVEFLVHKSKGNTPIFSVILANAVWFASAALRV